MSDLDELEEESEILEKAGEEGNLDDSVQLPANEAYSPRQAAELFRDGPTILIVLGGPSNCGKTTLLASLYERYRMGPFANHMLCWSSTLCGFERICHEGRDVSNRNVPDTQRTNRKDGRQYYDIRLFNAGDQSRCRLVFTDLSGEEFEDLRRFNDAVERLAVIKRADHFPLLIDGGQIIDVRKRHGAFDEACTILRTLLENSILGTHTHVQIVFSKWDLIIGSEPSFDSITFAEHAESRMQDQFGERFASLSFWRITARDPRGATPPAEGAEALITNWVSHRQTVAECDSPSHGCNLRPFDSFRRPTNG